MSPNEMTKFLEETDLKFELQQETRRRIWYFRGLHELKLPKPALDKYYLKYKMLDLVPSGYDYVGLYKWSSHPEVKAPVPK